MGVNPDESACSPADRLHIQHHALQRTGQITKPVQQYLTGGGRRDAAVVAFEQRNAASVLQV